MNTLPTKPDSLLLIGVGGLGTATALALAMNPISRLGLADPDQVALANLHRQILFSTQEIGQNKVTVAGKHLQAITSEMIVELIPHRLDTKEAIGELGRQYAVVIDASDNFVTRFAANDAAILEGFPLVHGAASGFLGQLFTIDPGRSACLRCLFTAPPQTTGPTCQNEGVLGPLVGEVGWLMAMEAIKLLRGIGKPLWNNLLTINALNGKRRLIPIRPNPQCPCHK